MEQTLNTDFGYKNQTEDLDKRKIQGIPETPVVLVYESTGLDFGSNKREVWGELNVSQWFKTMTGIYTDVSRGKKVEGEGVMGQVRC